MDHIISIGLSPGCRRVGTPAIDLMPVAVVIITAGELGVLGQEVVLDLGDGAFFAQEIAHEHRQIHDHAGLGLDIHRRIEEIGESR